MPNAAHLLFSSYKVKDTCTWPGTKWNGKGKDSKLLPCGKPTVGAGLFCMPDHKNCQIHSVCEQHDRERVSEEWEDEDA